MLRNYWKTPSKQSLAKLISLEKHSGGITGYPIYLLKNDLVNIVILTSYCLLTGANRTTGCRFWFRQPATKWVKTLRLKLGFSLFSWLQKEEYSFSSPIPSMQCCANVWATYRKQQTPQLWMEESGEGCYPIWSFEYNVSTILSQIVGLEPKNYISQLW